MTTENVENIMLEHLKKIQVELSSIREQNSEIMSRIAYIETGIARISRDESSNYTELVQDRHSMDILKERIKRIERRLEISL